MLWTTKVEGKLQQQRSSLRSGESDPQIRLPSLGVLYKEYEPPKCWALKTSGAYVQESQTAVENWDSTLKGHMQKLTHFESQCRGSSLKGATCWSWREVGGSWNAPWGLRFWQQPFLWSHSTLQTAALGGLPFWNPPPRLLPPGACRTHQCACSGYVTPGHNIHAGGLPRPPAHLQWLWTEDVCPLVAVTYHCSLQLVTLGAYSTWVCLQESHTPQSRSQQGQVSALHTSVPSAVSTTTTERCMQLT